MAAPDQIGTINTPVGPAPITASDILGSLGTFQGETANQLVEYFAENEAALSQVSNAFRVLGLASGAVLSTLEELGDGVPPVNAIADGVIDASLSTVAADVGVGVIVVGGAILAAPAELVAGFAVGAAVLCGYLGHLTAS